MALGFKQVKELLGKHGFGVIPRDSKDEAISKVAKVVAGWSDEEMSDKMAELPGELAEWINTELKLGNPGDEGGEGDTGGDTSTADASGAEAQSEAGSEGGQTETKATGKGKGAKGEKAAKPPKAEKPAKPKAEKTDLTLGSSFVCRRLCMEHPEWTLEQIIKEVFKVTGKEIKEVNASAIRSDFRRSVAVMIELGYVTEAGIAQYKKGEVKRTPPTPPSRAKKGEEAKTETKEPEAA